VPSLKSVNWSVPDL